jgi:hypothetical protein
VRERRRAKTDRKIDEKIGWEKGMSENKTSFMVGGGRVRVREGRVDILNSEPRERKEE